MKRVFATLLALFLVGTFSYSYAGDYTRHNALEIERTRGDDYEGRDSFRINLGDTTGTSAFRIDRSGNMWILDDSGTTTWVFRRDRYVIIDNADDLTQFDNALGGQSYFQTEPGRTYIVDHQGIIAGTSIAAISSVTALLPQATSSNNRQTVKIIYGHTYASGVSDTPVSLTVEVWPYPTSGATLWDGLVNISDNQNMWGSAAGVTIFSAGKTGYHNLNKYGENIEYMMMYNSAVSAIPVDVNAFDD